MRERSEILPRPSAANLVFGYGTAGMPVQNPPVGQNGKSGGSISDAAAAACRLPAWSPDGTKIVFSRRSPVPTSVAGIYSVNADGTGLLRLTTNGLGDTQPDWGTHPTS